MVPFAIDGVAGVTAIDASVAAVTVSVVLPLTAPLVAEMTVVPAATPVARPADPAALEIVAVAVVADAARTPSMGGGRPLLAVLEGLNDHENIGALFRNAAAFGVAAVLLDPTCADPLYRRSIRVSVGYALQVPFARLAPWPDALRQVRAAGFLVAALAPHVDVLAGGRVPIPVEQLQARLADSAPASPIRATNSAGPGVALVLGSEGPGLSGAALEAADEVVSIPMAPGVDSLNVATAAAVAFHRLSGL